MAPRPAISIRTPRLLLRRAAEGDLDAIHAIMSDHEAMRFWSTPPHTDREATRAWLASMIATPPDAGDDFIVEHEGVVIGKLGAWRWPEIGYILARPAWGRGFATEALAAFIDYAFDGRTDHLTADVDPRNLASLALLSRLGFSETGRAARTWRVGDQWCDSIYLRLDRRGG
jgi:[ribosomal protein S5]-alanine N-acetyltransferase